MMLQNKVSRYDVAEHALRGAAKTNDKVKVELRSIVSELQHRSQKLKEYVVEHGKDPDDTYNLPQFKGITEASGAKKSSGGGQVMYEG